MEKIRRPKIYLHINEDNTLTPFNKEGEQMEMVRQLEYKLVRESNGLTKYSKDVKWIEFGEDGRYKADYPEIKVGRNLLMSPFNKYFTWQTTEVVEIVEEKPDYVKFKTSNSVYELTKH